MTIKEYVLYNSKLTNTKDQIIAVLKHNQNDEHVYIEDVYKEYDSNGETINCIVIFEPSKDSLPISTFENIKIDELEIKLSNFKIDDDNEWLFKDVSDLKLYLESLERKLLNIK